MAPTFVSLASGSVQGLPVTMPANRLLADSGYAGEAVTLMAPQRVPALKTWGDVTVDLLKRLDMTVDFPAVDDSLSRIVGSGVKLGGGIAECAGSIRWLRTSVQTRP
jgi:hypothetical protein